MLEHLLVGSTQAQAPAYSNFSGGDNVTQPMNGNLGGQGGWKDGNPATGINPYSNAIVSGGQQLQQTQYIPGSGTAQQQQYDSMRETMNSYANILPATAVYVNQIAKGNGISADRSNKNHSISYDSRSTSQLTLPS